MKLKYRVCIFVMLLVPVFYFVCTDGVLRHFHSQSLQYAVNMASIFVVIPFLVSRIFAREIDEACSKQNNRNNV